MRAGLPIGARKAWRLGLVALVAASISVGGRVATTPAAVEPLSIPQEELSWAPDPAPQAEPALEIVSPAPEQEYLPSPEQQIAAEEAPLEALPEEYGTIDEEAAEVVRGEVSSRGGVRPTTGGLDGILTETLGDRISSIARQYVGFNYAWGGTSPRYGFDCSGFMWFVYREAGLPLPSRDLWGMRSAGQPVERDRLLPGDLVFFDNTYTYGLSHGGVYLGDNQFIHAVSEGVGVQIDPLEGSGWGSHYSGASRPW